MNDEAHTPPTPAAPASSGPAKSKAPSPLRLSALLEQVPPEYRSYVTTWVYETVQAGTLQGVKLTTTAKMDVATVLHNRQPGRLTSPEVLFLDTPDIRQQFSALVEQVMRERRLRDGGRGLTSADIDALTGDDVALLMAQRPSGKKKTKR
ncbi:hypothetical protein [Deinococcus sonorensis]|uniref:Uncharacterized protein n=2 Tax=Deinococcus sonorensis TaxID=309891 RepID=A0AAU7U6Q4_9DEIO